MQSRKPYPPEEYPKREIVNAILYVVCTGCAWRFVPNDLPPWVEGGAQLRRATGPLPASHSSRPHTGATLAPRLAWHHARLGISRA
jgi:transposase